MNLSQRTLEIVQEVARRARIRSKRTGFCIGNTRKLDEGGYYFSPIRETGGLIAGSIIVSKNEHAREVAAVVDGKVDYIFVDTEKKIPPLFGKIVDLCNIEMEVRGQVHRSVIHTYKGNDVTVESVDTLLAQLFTSLGGLHATILGAGNLGSKLALKLVERGAHVTITRRNRSKLNAIVRALNLIKPPETVARVHGTCHNLRASRNADILIGTSSGSPTITAAIIKSIAPKAIVMDGGKGCLTDEGILAAQQRGLSVYRFDSQSGFEGAVAQILRTEAILKGGFGRAMLEGYAVVSAGLLARRDEIIVDNVRRPTIVYGIADGQGDLVRHHTTAHSAALKALQRIVLAHGGVDSSPPSMHPFSLLKDAMPSGATGHD